MVSNETFNYSYPKGPGFMRFTGAGFCPPQPYLSFLDGLLIKFDEANFYTNILQFVLVSLMCINVGKGRYWKILFYAGIAGLMGTLIENGSIAYVCRQADIHNERYHIYGFFIAEVFWIVKEYAIPFLNLTKIKVYSDGATNKILTITIYILFVAFVAARFYIGYHRYKSGILIDSYIRFGHMVAFSIMALADLICTIGILYFVGKHNKQEYIQNNYINQYIKRSSYFILVGVDIVSILLVIFNTLTEYFGEQFPESFVKPFHSIKCSFILILACDALLFKYSVNTSSVHDSSNYKYGNFNHFINNNKNNDNINNGSKSHNYGLKVHTVTSMTMTNAATAAASVAATTPTNPSTPTTPTTPTSPTNSISPMTTTSITNNQKNSIIQVTPFNYPLSTDYNTKKNSIISGSYQSKNIIKNYTHLKSSPSLRESFCDLDKTLPTPKFGFLSQTKDY